MSNDRPQVDEVSSLQTDEHKDQLADQVSESFAPGDTALTVDQTATEAPQETALEEERIKDEIEIQIDLLKDPDWAVRREAVITLGEMGDERCVEPLVKALQDGDWQVREVAIEALGMVGSPAVEKLVSVLGDKDENTRKQAVIALGRIQDPAALDPLIEKLKDKDWFTRLTAAAALEKIGDERGRDAIKPLLKDSDTVVKMRVERILAAWKKRTANA